MDVLDLFLKKSEININKLIIDYKNEMEEYIKQSDENCKKILKKNHNSFDYYSLYGEKDLYLLEKYKDKLPWHIITYSKKLSEEDLITYKDYVSWHWVPIIYKDLSEEFKIKMKQYLN